MKVKIPQRNKIGTLDYGVVYREHMKVDDNWRGSINRRTGLIAIDPECGVGKDRSFLHEIVHQIDFNYECNLDEDTTSRLAHGFAEFLFNNLGIEFDWSDIN